MSNNEKTLELNYRIKKKLVDAEIILSKRIKDCGNWFNKQKKNTTKIVPIRFFCMKWECRVCRQKIIEIKRTKHLLQNYNLINEGGKIILITFSSSKINYPTLIEDNNSIKKPISMLKESRGWKKMKILINGKHHYDHTEVIYNNGAYQIFNHVVYGFLNHYAEIKNIEQLISKYWMYICRKAKNNIFTNLPVTVSTFAIKNHVSHTNKNKVSSYYGDVDICHRSDVTGTLDNLEQKYFNVSSQPSTSLKSFEYLKSKELKNIKNIILNINYMNKSFRNGRVWILS